MRLENTFFRRAVCAAQLIGLWPVALLILVVGDPAEVGMVCEDVRTTLRFLLLQEPEGE